MNEMYKKPPCKMLVHSYIDAKDMSKLRELIDNGLVTLSLSAIVAAAVTLGLPLLERQASNLVAS
jgi:hypothetical protein